MKRLLKNIQQEKRLIIRSLIFLMSLICINFIFDFLSEPQPVYFGVQIKNTLVYNAIKWLPLVSFLFYIFTYFFSVAKYKSLKEIIDDYFIGGGGYINKFINPKYDKCQSNTPLFLETDKKGKTFFWYNWNLLLFLIVVVFSIHLSSKMPLFQIVAIQSRISKTNTTKIKIYQKELYGKEHYFLTIANKDYEISKTEYNQLISDKTYVIYEKESWLSTFYEIKMD